jgi:thiamine-phosphate pyrophosphorylase
MLHYAITDPKYYTSNQKTLQETLKKVLLQKRVDIVSLRDKKTDKYVELAKSFLSIQSEYPLTKFILHTDYQLALNLGAFGVHLPSSSLDKIGDAKSKGLWVIASTHSLEEATFAEKEGADAITYSPIFETPGKGNPKGLEKLKEIKGKIAVKLFALGGIITESHIEAVKGVGVDGFASIRYFIK